MNGKERVAAAIADRIQDGQIVGVGTGTTVELAISIAGERIRREKLRIRAVPTSEQTAWLCEKAGFDVLYQGYCGGIEWGFDGADVVDDRLRAIKGKGGAMLQEKILAARCNRFTLIIDDSKLVPDISDCPVPVEVAPTAVSIAERGFRMLGARSIELRQAVKKHGPVITESGNVIFDVLFKEITDGLDDRLKSIVGVIESGIFIKLAHEVLVGSKDSVRLLKTTL